MKTLHDALPRTAEVVAADFAAGQHRGFQIYVSLDGRAVADAASGESAPGVPLTPDTLVCWLSSGKPLTAAAIGLLWQRGRLQLDDPVSDHVPEFAANGKAGVTIRHLLTHTGGFPAVETRYPQATWKESVAAVCAAPLEPDWVPGRTAGYHPASSWFLLGEIVRRVSGEEFAEFIRSELCGRMTMFDTHFALSPEEAACYGDRVGRTGRRTGKTLEPLDWHEPPRLGRASPGSSARGPVRDLGRFYEAMLAILEGGTGPLSPQTAEAFVSPHRVGEFDRTFRHVVDFGLGFLVNSNRYGFETLPYGFGRHASPRAFGHGGAQSSIGFADPEHGLVVAWAFDSLIGEPRHNARNRGINTAIYEDLLGVRAP